MSLFWMAVVAAIVLVEKALPVGPRVTRLLGIALVGLGIWIAAAPASVPNLTDPAGAETMAPMG
jgi:predicted metal-binding membrane protein